jgi:hypothetical protein
MPLTCPRCSRDYLMIKKLSGLELILSARDESRDPFPGTSDAGLTLYFIVLAIHWMIQSSVAFGSLVKSQGS